MVGVLIQMKVAVLRHSLRVEGRSTWLAIGGTIGVTLALGTIALGTRSFAHDALAGDLMAAAFAAWLFGWLVAAIFTGGSDDTLRPEFFTMLPVSPRRLAASLLGAAVVGVAPLVTLVAFTGLVVYAARFGVGSALVAIPAVLLELAFVILAARVVIGILGVVIHSRLSAALAACANALLAVIGAQGWVVIVAVIVEAERMANEGLPATVSTALRAIPSGWGVVAVDAAGRGDWPLALGALFGLAALIGLLLLVWSALLVRRTTTVPTGQEVRSGASLPDRLRRRFLPATGTGAVVAKELSSWSRDLMRVYNLSFALCYSVLFCLAPLLLGSPVMLPFVGALVVVMTAANSANLYGFDGSALWLTVMTPGVARTDVRGRQWAWLLTIAPLSLALTLTLTAASGQTWAWPWVLALLPALLGGGAGLVTLIAVTALVPGTDPHKRSSNPLNFGENEAGLIGLAYLMLLLVPLTALPAAGIVAAGMLNDNPLLLWSGLPVGLASGLLCAWFFGHLAALRLAARGPELLQLMRVGTSAQAKVAKAQTTPLPRGKAFIVGLCWTVCWIPLFPQGIVPLVMKLTDSTVRSWFLALYLPPAFQWPVIFAMIALGSAMLYTAIAIQRDHDRKHTAPPAAP